MIKTPQKVGREEPTSTIIKAIYDKSTFNIILNGEKLKAFPLRSETRQGCLLLPFLFNIVPKVLAREIKHFKRKKEKISRLEREKVKLTSNYRGHDLLYRKR